VKILAAFMLSVMPMVANACRSQANGNWSSPATWTNCGGTVPGSGDKVAVLHTVAIDQNIAVTSSTVRLGIRNIQIAGGVLVTDGRAPHTINFGSTGNDPVGSGTAEMPGADATMFGFLVDSGTLDFSAATAANSITITTANRTSPSFVRHSWGGGGFFASGIVRLKYTILKNIGTNTPDFEGVHVDNIDGGSALSVDHCYFISPYIAIYGYLLDGASITFNSFTGARGPQTVYLFQETGWTVTDNTEINPAAAGVSIYALYAPSGVNVLRNASLGSSLFSRTLYTAGGPNTMTANSIAQYNIAEFMRDGDPYAVGLGGTGQSGFTMTIDSNVIQRAYQGIYPRTGSTVTSNVITTAGGDYGGQGMIFVAGDGTAGDVIVTLAGNMMALDSNNQGNIGIFSYNKATQISARNTVVMMNPDLGNSAAMCACENGYPSVNSLVKNSIAEYGSNGVSFSPGSTYLPDFAGAGVHHNDVIYSTNPYGLPVTAHGSGFDNGTVAHPSAIYGDVSLNPGLVNSGRRLEDYDALIGGPGTAADLFNGLAARCGLTGPPWKSAYDPLKIYNWMRMGFAPTEVQLATLADDGGYIGAVKPIAIGAFLP
jgi:hypothetical protein